MAFEDLLEPAAPEPAPTPDAAPPAPPATPEPTPEPDMFPRDYVEKLRAEAAGYRTSYNPYKDVFGDADEEIRDYLLELNKLLITSPLEALDELESLTAQLKEAKGKHEPAPTPAPSATNPVSDKAQPMTRADWERIRDEETEAKRRSDDLDAIYKTVAELQYDRENDEFGDLASLLAIATKYTDGDLNKAHEKRVARFESEVEKRVIARMEEIRNGKAKWPNVSSAGASPVSPGEPPKTIQEAGRAARNYINKLYENQV